MMCPGTSGLSVVALELDRVLARARCRPGRTRSAAAGRRAAAAASTSVRAVAPIATARPWADAAGTATRSAARASSDAIRRGTAPTLVARDRVPHGPERFLDVYRRNAGHRDGEQHHLAGALRHPGARRDVAEEHRDAGAPRRPPRAARRASPRPASAARRRRSPSSAAASSAHTGTDVSITAIVIASSSRLRLSKPPCCMRSTRERLDRDPVLVGLEPDVAEEDAVGVRDRLAAQRDRLRRRGSGPTAGAAGRAAPAATVPARSRTPSSPAAGPATPGRARPRPRPRRAAARRSRAASSSCSSARRAAPRRRSSTATCPRRAPPS